MNDEEAHALLLSIDPLAALAKTQEPLHRRLEELTPTDDEELRALWQRPAEAVLKEPAAWRGAADALPAQFLVLVT